MPKPKVAGKGVSKKWKLLELAMELQKMPTTSPQVGQAGSWMSDRNLVRVREIAIEMQALIALL